MSLTFWCWKMCKGALWDYIMLFIDWTHPWPKVDANVTYSFNLQFKMLVRTWPGKWRLPLLLPKEQLDCIISQLSLSASVLPWWLLSTYFTWHTPCEWPLYPSLKQEPTPNFYSNIYVPQIKAGQWLLCILIKSFKNYLFSRFHLDLPRCSLINEELSIFLLRVVTLQYSKIPYHWCNNC